MTSEHLTPEAFVDVLERAPVEASTRRHLDACAACREELADLERTLSLLNEDVEHGFGGRRRLPVWSLAAAAVIAAVVGASFLVEMDAPKPPDSVDLEELLPPVEEDEAFQLLLDLSEASDVELGDLADETFDVSVLDPSSLSPDERQRFLERLTEEMRSSL